MQIGVSGLRAESEALGVVGDNVANVSTVGFKRQRSEFEDVLTRNGGQGSSGSGVRQNDVRQLFTQGSLAQTGVATDIAVGGEGFFVVNGTVDGMTGAFYTRAGQFHLDPSGALVDPSGLAVMGRTARPDGTLASSVSKMVVPPGSLAARPTTALQINANLDASAPIAAAAFDPQDPNATANFSTAIQVFDSLGAAHSVDVYFVKNGTGQWEYHALAKGDELNPPQSGQNVELGSGNMTFNGDGALDNVSVTTPISVSFNGASANQNVSIDFGSTLAGGGSGLDGTTQFSMPTGVSAQSQDGYSSGALSGISIGADGTVEGLFTNGERAAIGQLVLAKFRSQEGLIRAGNGLFAETRESGNAVLGAPGSGGRGSLSAGAIETSNVDLAEEFVDMIRHQRAFSADSKVISTADDMLSELMQLKR
jgi:flagellar hook protein FlgE